jgi:hypothetical protein
MSDNAWNTPELDPDMVKDIPSHVLNNKAFVAVEAYELLTGILADVTLLIEPTLTDRELAILAGVVQYYGDFNKLLLDKHAKDLVPDSPETLS